VSAPTAPTEVTSQEGAQNAGLRAADPTGVVPKRAAASLPDWPSSVRIAHSGPFRMACVGSQRAIRAA